MIGFALLAVLCIIIGRILNKQSPPAILGIYQNPGKWYYLKVCLMNIILIIRKVHYLALIFWGKNSKQAGYGHKSKVHIEDMEKRQPLSSHPKAIDAVYFNLASKSGWHLVVGTAQRPHGVVNGFLYLKVPDIGLLVTPKLPDTMLFSENERDDMYGAEGIVIYPFQAMRVWKIQYRGKMLLHDDPSQSFDVNLNAVWSSELRYFDFDTDMDQFVVARSISMEPWSREYFQNLKEFHQTHYEQHGDAHVHVHINEESYRAKLNGVRDHSYADKREWKVFYRYVLHFITLENGTRISIGIICTPLMFSRIELGYLHSSTGDIYPIQDCSLQLYQHGENGTPPRDYGFSFKAGGEDYEVKVKVSDAPEFYIGWEWEVRIVEQLVRFTVNGVPGWGAAEWEYRHAGGRPSSVKQTDPAWTADIVKG